MGWTSGSYASNRIQGIRSLSNAHGIFIWPIDSSSLPLFPYTLPMSKEPTPSRGTSTKLEIVEPIGDRVLIRKDEDRKTTKTGIHLPDKIEIPTLAGRIVAISSKIEKDADYPIKKYDRVLFNPKHAIPVEFEGDNRLFVIPVEDVVAVFRSEKSE